MENIITNTLLGLLTILSGLSAGLILSWMKREREERIRDNNNLKELIKRKEDDHDQLHKRTHELSNRVSELPAKFVPRTEHDVIEKNNQEKYQMIMAECREIRKLLINMVASNGRRIGDTEGAAE